MKSLKDGTYNSYLRDCGIYNVADMNKLVVKNVEVPKIKFEELCNMHFTNKHSCVVGAEQCIFAHHIKSLREYERGNFNIAK